jgi:hypothetical protein
MDKAEAKAIALARELEEAKAAAKREMTNEKNSVDYIFKDLVENKRLEASAKNKSIVLADDCNNRSTLEKMRDCGRD